VGQVYQDRLVEWHAENQDESPSDHDDALHLQRHGDQVSLPASISKRLLDYQVDGIKWLWGLHIQGAGGILGDEMVSFAPPPHATVLTDLRSGQGLGKTVQICAYLEMRSRAGDLSLSSDGPALIICPATMLSHWLREVLQPMAQ
jgi:DNA excision repair protein ERCC-6